MAGNEAFVMAYRRGWRGGLRNMLSAELGKWFRTNTWWVQSLIWIAVTNGVLAGILWSDEGMEIFDAAAFFILVMRLSGICTASLIRIDMTGQG